MTINETIVKKLEHTYRKSFSDGLKQYLLVKYAEEPFPYEFSEQDLYTNILQDIRNYEAGELDITIKSAFKRWQEEREYLQNLYIDKLNENRDLAEYIIKLEHMLSEYGLALPR
jgi:hypothetical protein